MEILGQVQHCTILNKMYLNDRKMEHFHGKEKKNDLPFFKI